MLWVGILWELGNLGSIDLNLRKMGEKERKNDKKFAFFTSLPNYFPSFHSFQEPKGTIKSTRIMDE